MALCLHRLGALQCHAIEAPWPLWHQRAGGEVARVEGLQRVLHHDVAARVAAGGVIDRVEQLADRNGGRAWRVGALVLARVGDDQLVGRRQQGVEKHLAVLHARVAVADVRIAEDQVVAVTYGLARELAVVEAEQADDAMRHRAHRHERADRQVPGAEVGAGRPALEPVGEQRAHLRQRELRGGRARHARLADDVVEQSLELGALPGVEGARRGERVGGGGERVRPSGHALRHGHRVDGCMQAVDQLREAACELDRLAVDVVQGKDAAEQPLILLGHRDAEQQPVQPGAPGAGVELVELEGLAVGGVEPPADPALRNPLLHAREVAVVEPEPAPDGIPVGEVEHLRGCEALVADLEQARHEAEQRVRLPQRTVGEPDTKVGRAQLVRKVVELVVVRADLAGPERGLDERRERLDVGAHHDHVARLERRVLGEQVQDGVPEHLDLAGAAVARVDLDAAVDGTGLVRRGLVAAHRLLDPGEQGVVALRRGVVVVPVRLHDEVQLARVLPPRRQQPVVRERLRGVLGAAPLVRRPGDLLPQRGRRVEEEQVDIPMGRERGEDLEPGGGQARQAEHREPCRKVDKAGFALEPLARGVDPLGGIGLAHPLAESAPQVRLPGRVGREPLAGRPHVAALRPRPHHRRPLDGVAVVELGDVADAREPPRLPGGVRRVHRRPEVHRQVLQPRLVQRPVDDFQQRPHEPLRPPCIGVRLDSRRGRDRVFDQAPRGWEVHVRAYPVLPPGRRPRGGGEPLREPPLHAARGHRDDLGGEGIPERLDEAVGALGSMDMQHGSATIGSRPDDPPPGAPVQPGRRVGRGVVTTFRSSARELALERSGRPCRAPPIGPCAAVVKYVGSLVARFARLGLAPLGQTRSSERRRSYATGVSLSTGI